MRRLPKIRFQNDKLCGAYQMDKQIKVAYKDKNIMGTYTTLELLHMDLSDSRYTSLNCNRYYFVIVYVEG